MELKNKVSSLSEKKENTLKNGRSFCYDFPKCIYSALQIIILALRKILFDPSVDDIESWLARFDVFITISQEEDRLKGFYLLNALSSNAHHVLAAFAKPAEATTFT
ncbi:unnamed protein product [Enterobius vermicularis]|uniref:Uncharacterized protein n=1 Tax=Enterobius vermicularis TaxID=51028 RepID=A0A0N4V0V6_ENTVE|nr:unnamed protein product [Enterobius vermicularis]